MPGTRVVLTATAGLTGQNVKRAAAGAEGLVHDHYDADAVRQHLTALGDRLIAAVGAHRLGSVFCDSLEVYGADWTPDLPPEFARRRGYDLRPSFGALVDDGPDSQVIAGADYHRTLSELYEDTSWSRSPSGRTAAASRCGCRATAMPPATLSSYAPSTCIEGEQWGWTRMPPTQVGVARPPPPGRPLVSVGDLDLGARALVRATPLDLQGRGARALPAGHQPADRPRLAVLAPAGRADAALGWFFYASAALDDRNAWWPAART